MASSADPVTASVRSSLGAGCLDISGLRNFAVKEYNEWQQSKVGDEALKMELQKACNVTLGGLDLEQVYEDQDPDFFIINFNICNINFIFS
jgi:hypothetical protein